MEINPLYPALISGFIGTIIGGCITLIATLMNQHHQQKLQQQTLDHEIALEKRKFRINFLVDRYNRFLSNSSMIFNNISGIDLVKQLPRNVTHVIAETTSDMISTADSKLETLALEITDLILSDNSNLADLLGLLADSRERYAEIIAELSKSTFDTPTS